MIPKNISFENDSPSGMNFRAAIIDKRVMFEIGRMRSMKGIPLGLSTIVLSKTYVARSANSRKEKNLKDSTFFEGGKEDNMIAWKMRTNANVRRIGLC